MKKLLFGIVIVVTLMLTYVSGQLFFAYRNLSEENSLFQNRLVALKTDNERLKADLEYYKSPENSEKELRGTHNYKNPGETLVIGVLKKDPSATANAGQAGSGQVPSDATTTMQVINQSAPSASNP